ncbi:MAG: hypothetical protein DME61_03220 [Verrucomicrobia bacterium]|nr:MAG: hypothetical protein DME61_03220 [Verrucomicrobiota bacterium]
MLASLPAVAGLIYFSQLNRQIENARTNNADASGLKSAEFSRILLIKLSGLGDVVHTLPVLVKLRARYPAARIDWLITPENAEIVRCHPALSNVVLFERRDFSKRDRRWRAVLAFLDLLKQIRRAKYDLVIDLHGQARSAFFTLASGARVRIGFDRPVKNISSHGWRGAREGSWIAYTHRIPIPTLDVHAIDRYLWVGPLLGLDKNPPDLTIHLSSQTARNVQRFLEDHGVPASKALAVLAPGTTWETKHWTIEGFAAVARHFLDEGFAVALAGTKRDEPRCRQIAAAAPGACAASLGTPMVSVFGPTNPVRIGPYQRPESVVRLDLPCSPCNYRRLSQCPFDHACMKQLTSAMVVERVQKILGAPKSHAELL